MRRLAVLASGNGSNLQAIIDAAESGALPGVRVAVVVADRREAYALERAKKHGIPTLYHPFLPYRKAGRSRADYDADLAAKLAPYEVDLVVLAGWMRILSMAFLQHYSGRVLNLHPALPGTFPGTHAIERAYEASRRGEIAHTGVMVHRVPDEGVDVGPVVVQQVVPIYPEDTLEMLESRIHEAEHALYVRAIQETLKVF
ncbi:MAG: phosphoribosylglycinamide formyltransferase [Chloroflexi bacterium]|nr:phosphoribosylglycinamide formyltransferase [Chloroflexota bacterium]